MFNDDFSQTNRMSSAKSVELSVSTHKSFIKESLETLQSYLNEIVEYSYSGDIISTVRAVRKLKDESDHLSQTIDHFLLSIEQYCEPDHGGD